MARVQIRLIMMASTIDHEGKGIDGGEDGIMKTSTMKHVGADWINHDDIDYQS